MSMMTFEHLLKCVALFRCFVELSRANHSQPLAGVSHEAEDGRGFASAGSRLRHQQLLPGALLLKIDGVQMSSTGAQMILFNIFPVRQTVRSG